MTAFFKNQAAVDLFECGERNVFPDDVDPFLLKIRSFFSGAWLREMINPYIQYYT